MYGCTSNLYARWGDAFQDQCSIATIERPTAADRISYQYTQFRLAALEEKQGNEGSNDLPLAVAAIQARQVGSTKLQVLWLLLLLYHRLTSLSG